MADTGGGAASPLLENFIFQDIDGSISHILGELSNRPKSEVAERLVHEIDLEDIGECREFLFKTATGLYDEQIEAAGIADTRARLELKQRRGDSVREKCAEDIVEMACYICGITKYFPRNVLSSRSIYVDIEVKESIEKSTCDNVKDNNHDFTADVALNTEYKRIHDRCENMESSIKRLWEYIYNIERVHADEIKQVRELNATRPGSNELNASSQSNRVTGDWPTLPSNPSHPQASQTTRATSATGQRNGSDVGAPATRVISELNESSLSVLLTDDHISTNRYIVLNDSDIIPCGQIPMSQKQMNVPSCTSASQPNDTREISGLDKNICVSVQVPSPSPPTRAPGHSASGPTREAANGTSGASQTPPHQQTNAGVVMTRNNTTQAPSPTTVGGNMHTGTQKRGQSNASTNRNDNDVISRSMPENTDITRPSTNNQSTPLGYEYRNHDGEWQVSGHARRGRQAANTGTEPRRMEGKKNTALKGIRREQAVELYVQNIASNDDETNDDIADKLR